MIQMALVKQTAVLLFFLLILQNFFFSKTPSHKKSNVISSIPDGDEMSIAIMALETESLIWTVKPKPHLQKKVSSDWSMQNQSS